MLSGNLMKCILQAYMSVDGLQAITTQSQGEVPIQLDRVSLHDNIGCVVQLDAGIVYQALSKLAAARNITVTEYLCKFQHTLDK
jgi:hypothetical protein